MKTKTFFSDNFKSQLSSFERLLRYTLKTTLSSPRIYIYCFLLPLIFYSGIYLNVTSFGYVQVSTLNRVSTLASLLLAPCFALMAASCIITNWKYSVMVKQFKIFRITKVNLIFALLITTIIITFLSFIAIIVWGCLLDLTLANKNFITSLQILNSFPQFVGIFFALIYGAVIMFSIAYIFSFLISSPILIQTLNVIIILYIMTSANIIGLNIIVSKILNQIFNIMGYFNPLKAVQWILFSSYANLLVDADNARQIIASPYSDFPYTFYSNDINLILWIAQATAFGWAGSLFTTTFFIKFKS